MIPKVKYRIRELVESAGNSARDQAPERVWNLNLDQIEPNTGKVIERIIVNQSELGPSVARFDAQTVLYSKLRPYLNKVVLADQPGYATTELVPLRCNESVVLPKFLAHYLRSPKFVQFASAIAAGAKMPRMVMGEFWAHEFFVPPLPEQRSIAEILDKAEALRAKRRAVLAKLDALAQSIFLDMFGDPVQGQSEWPAKKLGGISKFENGDRSSNYPSGDDIKSDGVLFLSTKNIAGNHLNLAHSAFISKEKFKSLSRGKVQRNDIIITLRGTLGNCAIFDCNQEEAFINAQLMIIRPKSNCHPVFLHALLSSHQAKSRFLEIGNGAAVPQLTSKQLSEIDIYLPPLPLQQAFARRIETLEALKARHRASLTKLDVLFASLQHRAFRGEL